MNLLAWVIFALAALIEVSGDAFIRRGMRGSKIVPILIGCAVLCVYGILVNTLKWEFSKTFGVYVGFFALVSLLIGRFVFREQIPLSTWLGLAIILAGCMVIQFGRR